MTLATASMFPSWPVDFPRVMFPVGQGSHRLRGLRRAPSHSN